MPISVADVITEYGAYYKNNRQNMNSLLRMQYNQTETTQYMTPALVDGTRWEAAKFTMGQILQPFQRGVTPAGSVTVKPVTWNLFHHKFDLVEFPDEIEATWLGFLADDSVNRKDWPFVRWLAEQAIAKSIRDYELAEVYKGVYAAPTVGTAGPPGTSMNGIGKLLADQITAGNITPITLGALSTTATTFVDQVETFARSIIAQNEDYAAIPMNIFMSKVLAQRFAKGYREKYGNNTDFKGPGAQVIDTNFTVIGLSSMSGRSRIWTTPKENFIDLRFRTPRQGQIQIEGIGREIHLLGDHWRGVGFGLTEAIFCSELA
jgi:hypothetical protein